MKLTLATEEVQILWTILAHSHTTKWDNYTVWSLLRWYLLKSINMLFWGKSTQNVLLSLQGNGSKNVFFYPALVEKGIKMNMKAIFPNVFPFIKEKIHGHVWEYSKKFYYKAFRPCLFLFTAIRQDVPAWQWFVAGKVKSMLVELNSWIQWVWHIKQKSSSFSSCFCLIRAISSCLSPFSYSFEMQ